MKTLVIEKVSGETDVVQSYVFMLEQRNGKTLIINTNTGVWKIDSRYDELFQMADIDGQRIRIHCGDFIWRQLTEDRLMDDVPTDAGNRSFGLLILGASERCNLRCKYCFEGAADHGENMSCETAVRAFQKFITLENNGGSVCVEFSGGEALLHFDMIQETVPQILRLGNETGRKVTFTVQTNGTLLTPDMAAFFKKYHFSVGVSLDGTEDFNDNRIYDDGHGTFQDVIRSVQLLKEYGVHYSTISVIHRPGQLRNIINLMGYTGCEQFRANLIHSIGRGKDVWDESMSNMKQIAREYVTFCRQMLRDKKYHEANAMYYFLSLLLYHPFMCFKEPCGAGMNQLYVSPNGDVYLCQKCRFVEKGCIGNVYSEDTNLAENIQRDAWFHEMQNPNTALSEECESCPWKKFCCSCPCVLYNAGGKLSGKSIFCEFYQYVFRELIWMIYDDPIAVIDFLHPGICADLRSVGDAGIGNLQLKELMKSLEPDIFLGKHINCHTDSHLDSPVEDLF